MSDEFTIDWDAPPIGDDYEILPDGRVPVYVSLTVEDDA